MLFRSHKRNNLTLRPRLQYAMYEVFCHHQSQNRNKALKGNNGPWRLHSPFHHQI